MLENPDREVAYRINKWILRNLEKEQLLKPEELESIWTELLAHYEPPTQSLETVTTSIRGDGCG